MGGAGVSLILEALSRSSRDRNAGGQSPGLDTPAYVDEPRQRPYWLAVLPWSVLVLALIAIGFLLFDKYAIDHAAVGLAGASVRVQKDSLRRIVPEQEVAAFASNVARQRESEPLESAPEAVRAVVAPTPPRPRRVNAELADPAVTALYADEPVLGAKSTVATRETDKPEANRVETSANRSERVIDIEDVLARTKESLKDSQLSEHSAPFLAEVSQQFKDKIPTIMYRRHDYSSKPGQSSVTLNGKVLKAGATLGGGVKVDEILSDSVVLNYRGKPFRLRALNSWSISNGRL